MNKKKFFKTTIKSHIKVILFLLILSTNLFAQRAFKGTFIVILQINDTIFVSGDSKITGVADNENIFGNIFPPPTESYQKIGFVGKVGYAVAGLIKGANNFDLGEFCQEACKIGGSIFDIAKRFNEILENPIKTIWANVKEPLILTPDPIVNYEAQTAFFGFYKGSPVIIKETFIPGRDTTQFNVKIDLPKSAFIDSAKIRFLGLEKQIFEVMKHKNISFVGGFCNATREMVDFAIHKFPDVCGNPIKTIICTQDGFTWIDSKNPCK